MHASFGIKDKSTEVVREIAHTLFLPQGVEIELILALRAAVSKLQTDFQKLPYLGMKLGH